MQVNVKSYMTAGVAMVGAGAIALAPISPPADTSDKGVGTYEVSLAAASHFQQQQDAFAASLASNPISSLIEGIIDAYKAPGNRPYEATTGIIDGVVHIGQGVAASGLRFGDAMIRTPLRFAALPFAFLGGTGPEAVSDLITNLVDGPLWVIDPILYGLRDSLPAPFGGTDGIIQKFRDQVLWMGTQEINDFIANPAGALRSFVDGIMSAYAAPGNRPYEAVTGPFASMGHITEGFIASGMRFVEAAIITPLRFAYLPLAFANGTGPQAVSQFITDLVDGPLWVADPILYGLRDALPSPFGGPGDSVMLNFRNGLWALTEQINDAIGSLFGAPAAPAVNELSEKSGPSGLPDPNARTLTLSLSPDSDVKVDLAAEGSDKVTTPADEKDATEPVAEETVTVDPVAEETVTEEEAPALETVKDPKPTQNVVKDSPNYSPGADNGVDGNGSQDGADADLEEAEEEAAEPEVKAPEAKPTEAKTGAADADQSNDGVSGGDE
jgi:hypothetical protein